MVTRAMLPLPRAIMTRTLSAGPWEWLRVGLCAVVCAKLRVGLSAMVCAKLRVGLCVVLCAMPCVRPAGAGMPPPSDSRSRGIDWESVRQKARQHPWADGIVEDLERSIAATQADFPDLPLGVTGWAHDYFCAKDAQPLRYDPRSPQAHTCPRCGVIYRGRLYDEAWMDTTYRRLHRAARDAGVLYRLRGDGAAAAYGRHVLLWFAEHIDRFPAHGYHQGRGHIMGESLGEAAAMIDFALAYWDLSPLLTEGERDLVARRLLLPGAEFLHEQVLGRRNIHVWLNAAVGMIGLACDEPAWVARALDGPRGLAAQLAIGVQEDGFWCEGSIAYHFHVLRAVQDFLMALEASGRAFAGADAVRRMYGAPLAYACGSGGLPAINDGWNGRRLSDYADCYEYGAARCPEDDEIPRVLRRLYRERKRDSVAALLLGPERLPPETDWPRASGLLRDVGFAVLRGGPFEALIKFGPYGGGHDHRDRLNLILYAEDAERLPDLGTAGYGLDLNAWYRSPAAHNVLVVDGRRQARCGGYLESFSDGEVTAGVRDAYRGVDLRRTVALAADGITDRVSASSGAVHTYDLFYHVRGTLSACSVALEPRGSIPDGGAGYEWLREIRGGPCAGRSEFVFSLPEGGRTLKLECLSSVPCEVFTGVCPDNPADRTLSFLMIRSRGEGARYEARIIVE